MYFDGALNLEGIGAGVLFIAPDGQQLKYVLQIHYKASNNGAEYEALIHGLRIVISLGIKRLLCYGDSKLVVEQVNKNWDTTKETMSAYCADVRKLEAHFYGLEVHHVVRDDNVAADVLSKLGSKRAHVPVGVFVQDLRAPSIKMLEDGSPALEPPDEPQLVGNDVLVIETDWHAPFNAWIVENKVPDDKAEADMPPDTPAT
ncbi:unnamed protein product [Urochloa decumbens]|uniref:RNase H type-1 domain-containing protein n=1 Tax=Urochloa decumbens TaxID=240449 RepID=A0ABC8ZR86_9POAL